MKKITLSVVLALVLLSSVTFAASAKANRTYFTAVEYDCFTGMGTEPRVQGNVMHMRDVFHVNVDVSDTPEFKGSTQPSPMRRLISIQEEWSFAAH